MLQIILTQAVIGLLFGWGEQSELFSKHFINALLKLMTTLTLYISLTVANPELGFVFALIMLWFFDLSGFFAGKMIANKLMAIQKCQRKVGEKNDR